MSKLKSLCAVAMATLLLSGCNKTPEPEEEVSDVTTSATFETTLYSVVELPPVYTSESTRAPSIWEGNDGILTSRDEKDYPIHLFEDSYDTVIDTNHMAGIDTIQKSKTKHSLAESVNIASAPAYELVFNGLNDNKLSFSVMNKRDVPVTFKAKCLSLNNIQATDTSYSRDSLCISEFDEITINSGDIVPFTLELETTGYFSRVEFTELVLAYIIDGNQFYGRIVAEDNDVYDGHVYADLYKAYKPVNYRYRCNGDKMFVYDGLYGYESSLDFNYYVDEDEDYNLELEMGLLNNSYYERDVKLRFVSINGEPVNNTDAVDIFLQPCCFTRVDMTAYFSKHITSIDSFDMEVTMDGISYTMHITLEEPLEGPRPAETVVTTVPSEEVENAEIY